MILKIDKVKFTYIPCRNHDKSPTNTDTDKIGTLWVNKIDETCFCYNNFNFWELIEDESFNSEIIKIRENSEGIKGFTFSDLASYGIEYELNDIIKIKSYLIVIKDKVILKSNNSICKIIDPRIASLINQILINEAEKSLNIKFNKKDGDYLNVKEFY